jgi:hypothetical protein
MKFGRKYTIKVVPSGLHWFNVELYTGGKFVGSSEVLKTSLTKARIKQEKRYLIRRYRRELQTQAQIRKYTQA